MLGTFFRRLLARHAPILQPGQIAPAFEVRDHLGRLVRSSDFQGRRFVLWFYPKADTPG
jgi:thioredoxin-dependent peroxiredoxin